MTDIILVAIVACYFGFCFGNLFQCVLRDGMPTSWGEFWREVIEGLRR